MKHPIILLTMVLTPPAYGENCKTSVTGFTHCDNGRMFQQSSNGLILEYGTGNMWKQDSLGNTYSVYGNRPDATLPPALLPSPDDLEEDDD